MLELIIMLSLVLAIVCSKIHLHKWIKQPIEYVGQDQSDKIVRHTCKNCGVTKVKYIK